MLVLKRKEGQWIDITHRSGDTLRIRVYNIRSGYPAQLDLAFDDDARHFEIQRPGRKPLPLMSDPVSVPDRGPDTSGHA